MLLRRQRYHWQTLQKNGRHRQYTVLHHGRSSTLQDNTVTLRHRDSMKQDRVAISSLKGGFNGWVLDDEFVEETAITIGVLGLNEICYLSCCHVANRTHLPSLQKTFWGNTVQHYGPVFRFLNYKIPVHTPACRGKTKCIFRLVRDHYEYFEFVPVR